MTSPSLDTPYDAIVIGAGPAGSTLAYHLAKAGCRVLIIDKTPFPRHQIGESLTGETGKLVCEMGLGPKMKELGFPVKRGVKVLGPNSKSEFFVPVQDLDETLNLVPRTTWQVRRPEFDQMLLDAAIEAGAEFQLGAGRKVIRDGVRITGLVVRLPDGREVAPQSKFLADASGQSKFLSNQRVTGPLEDARYHKQIAFFAQMKGVRRDPHPQDGNTVLFYSNRDRWSWLIPLDEDVTSIGVVQPASDFKESGLTPEEFFAGKLRVLHPDLADRTSKGMLVSEVWRKSNYSYRVHDFVGDGFICIGDAHRFLDPIFSFGVWMGMKEAVLAASAIQEGLKGPNSEKTAFAKYSASSDAAQQVIQDIVNTFWEFPLVFLKLAHYSHKDQIADLFAGRIFDENVAQLEVVNLMRGCLSKQGL